MKTISQKNDLEPTLYFSKTLHKIENYPPAVTNYPGSLGYAFAIDFFLLNRSAVLG